jgi:hypothetical protein
VKTAPDNMLIEVFSIIEQSTCEQLRGLASIGYLDTNREAVD